MLLLPLPTSPAYNVLTEIEGVEYELVYTYDEHRDLWRLGVNRGDVVVMGHRPLLPFVQMRPNAFASALDGVFALIVPLATGDAYEALTGGLWSVVYGDPSEIAELTDSLADLAGDADDPVVPIDVIYPPNNAILSSPVVTFSGTGPANQLLFVRGESIQVDSMGSWVWTHTFSESNPVVVFEGESGQRATVRFSIIMQPLTINPIGEDINGTRYVFTEDVEITGTGQPNSAITVNGQSVSVDSDGNWSIELTLQAGQSHVITAQGGDGQVAQTSVYVWGEPDVLALQPDVWLDPHDPSTLFVDDAMTIPAVDGDPIGGWRNKGTLGSIGDAAQAVSASRPVWMDVGGWQLSFNPGNVMQVNHSQRMPATIVAVIEPNSSMVAPAIGYGSAVAVNGYRVYDTTNVLGASAHGVTATVVKIPPLLRVVIATFQEGESVSIDMRGVTQSSVNPAPATGNPLSSATFNLGSSGFTGNVRDVFLFDRILTESERVRLRAYLEAQHGN